MTLIAKIIVNTMLYNIAWTAAVLAAARGRVWVGIVVMGALFVAHAVIGVYERRELPMLLAGAAIGAMFDTAWILSGLFRLGHDGVGPILSVGWFLALWIGFTSVMSVSLRWMRPRPIVGVLFGAIGGPMAYWIASRLGAVSFASPAWAALLAVAAQYGVIVPLWGWLLNRGATQRASA